MIFLFSPFLFSVFMPLAVNAEVCGRTSGEPCNGSLLLAASQSDYLAASTSNLTLGFCIRLRLPGSGMTTITYTFENGTQAFEDTETITFTDVPDVVNVTFGSDPNTTYQVTIPYGDYEACFVGKIDATAMLGCRLWIFDNATSEQITACTEGHAEVCNETIYDTWNEEMCT